MSQNNLHRFCGLITSNIPRVEPKFKDPSYYSDKKPLLTNENHALYLDIFLGRKENAQFNFSFTADKDCKTSLIMNRSDIDTNQYIFHDTTNLIDESKIDVLGIIGDTRMYFVTGYSASNSTKYSDLMESLSSFSYFTWICFGLIIMTIHLLLKTSCKHLKERRKRRLESDSLLFIIISHFMK